ncbi:winged helix-turn-helix domain-containing protein [Azospirillum sp. B4]|uniref:ATP-binding protein n=1 Tax=Azospirillum sp. B4 TaxID=95605 RepID=UPI0003470CFD|nr:winged helix-turn-helix domain-containing protein [Azospirillum sp. B4]
MSPSASTSSCTPGPDGGEVVYRFGTFNLYPARQLLTSDRPVGIGGRALDILTALVERAGAIVPKDELVARAWPTTHVGENNLRVQVAKLRQALGDTPDGQPHILFVSGQGYRFTRPVHRQILPADQGAQAAPVLVAPPLPQHLSRPVGRADVIAAVAVRLGRSRLLTIVGPGGIGKTTVALALAPEVAGRYPDGVGFIDLSFLTDGALVPALVASRLAPHIQAQDPLPPLVAYLRPRRMLLILDSCEPVVGALAPLVEAILAGAPGIDILATSREPLGAEGEVIQRLTGLAVPAATEGLTAAQALSHAAVQLFVDRVAANLGGFELSDAEAPAVAEICRRLDGIPLGLELAAGPVAAHGVAGMAARLDDRFRLLVRGRRTAAARHQTLRAAFDWSYALLSPVEQRVLNRLGVFAGGFDLAAVQAVALDRDDATPAEDPIASLMAKSLVVAGAGGDQPRLRLLDTIRAYAREQLVASGELDAIGRRHAAHYLALMSAAAPQWETLPASEMLARHASEIHNIRLALTWFQSADTVGMRALTLAAMPVWARLSMWAEAGRWASEALALPYPFADERQQLQLLTLKGMAYTITEAQGDEAVRVWEAVLSMAERLQDEGCQLQALVGIWMIYFDLGRLRDTLGLARRFQAMAVAHPDRAAPALAERMIGASLYIMGDHEGGVRHTEAAIRLGRMAAPPGQIMRFHANQRVVAEGTLAGLAWLLGQVGRAQVEMRTCLEDADTVGHALTNCLVLGQSACPTALLMGDVAAAQHYGQMLLALAERHGMMMWRDWAGCFELLIHAKRAGVHADPAPVSRALKTLRDLSHPRFNVLLREVALVLGRAGATAEALDLIDSGLERSRRNEEGWCLPELMRLRGELLAGQGWTAEPEALFREALELAGRHRALSWQVRAAISLARLRSRAGGRDDAPDLLSGLLPRFDGGSETTDLRAARAFLDHFKGRPAPADLLAGPLGPNGGLLTA